MTENSDLLQHAAAADEHGTLRLSLVRREPWHLAENIHQVLDDPEKEESE